MRLRMWLLIFTVWENRSYQFIASYIYYFISLHSTGYVKQYPIQYAFTTIRWINAEQNHTGQKQENEPTHFRSNFLRDFICRQPGLALCLISHSPDKTRRTQSVHKLWNRNCILIFIYFHSENICSTPFRNILQLTGEIIGLIWKKQTN